MEFHGTSPLAAIIPGLDDHAAGFVDEPPESARNLDCRQTVRKSLRLLIARFNHHRACGISIAVQTVLAHNSQALAEFFRPTEPEAADNIALPVDKAAGIFLSDYIIGNGLERLGEHLGRPVPGYPVDRFNNHLATPIHKPHDPRASDKERQQIAVGIPCLITFRPDDDLSAPVNENSRPITGGTPFAHYRQTAAKFRIEP